MEQVEARKVGESGTYIYFRQAVWSALMISSAHYTMMILVESGPSILSLMLIYTQVLEISKFIHNFYYVFKDNPGKHWESTENPPSNYH